MNRNLVTGALLLIVSGLVAPVAAYHITGAEVPNQTGGTPIDVEGFTSADWQLGDGALIVCESNGPVGAPHPYRDERNPNQAGPGLVAVGGVCTGGHNIATYNQFDVAAGVCPGTAIDDNSCDDTDTDGAGADLDADTPMGVNARPNNFWEAYYDDWIRFDLCSATTITRDVGAEETDFEAAPWYDDEAPYNVNPAPCQYGVEKDVDFTNTEAPGNTADHGYSVEIGAFACFVPTDESLTAPFVYEDYALWYQAIYAYWSFDGTPNDTPFSGWANGHVAAFVNPDASDPDATTSGSVDIEFFPSPPFTADADGGNYELADDTTDRPAGSLLVRERVTNNCGASPSEPPVAGSRGPVMRAESDGSGCASGPTVIAC